MLGQDQDFLRPLVQQLLEAKMDECLGAGGMSERRAGWLSQRLQWPRSDWVSSCIEGAVGCVSHLSIVGVSVTPYLAQPSAQFAPYRNDLGASGSGRHADGDAAALARVAVDHQAGL